MSKGTTINARIDPDTKSKAQVILGNLGMTMSEAIAIYLRQVVYQRAIPFDIRIPNELTTRVMQETEQGKNLHEAPSVNAMLQEFAG